MKKDSFKKGEIIIYKTSKNEVELRVRFEEETVWLKQNEIADLFGKDRSVIAKHIKAIFKDQEVDKKSNVHFLHIANSDKPKKQLLQKLQQFKKKDKNIKIQYVPFHFGTGCGRWII